jgi:hypothetical protein
MKEAALLSVQIGERFATLAGVGRDLAIACMEQRGAGLGATLPFFRFSSSFESQPETSVAGVSHPVSLITTLLLILRMEPPFGDVSCL